MLQPINIFSSKNNLPLFAINDSAKNSAYPNNLTVFPSNLNTGLLPIASSKAQPSAAGNDEDKKKPKVNTGSLGLFRHPLRLCSDILFTIATWLVTDLFARKRLAYHLMPVNFREGKRETISDLIRGEIGRKDPSGRTLRDFEKHLEELENDKLPYHNFKQQYVEKYLFDVKEESGPNCEIKREILGPKKHLPQAARNILPLAHLMLFSKYNLGRWLIASIVGTISAIRCWNVRDDVLQQDSRQNLLSVFIAFMAPFIVNGLFTDVDDTAKFAKRFSDPKVMHAFQQSQGLAQSMNLFKKVFSRSFKYIDYAFPFSSFACNALMTYLSRFTRDILEGGPPKIGKGNDPLMKWLNKAFGMHRLRDVGVRGLIKDFNPLKNSAVDYAVNEVGIKVFIKYASNLTFDALRAVLFSALLEKFLLKRNKKDDFVLPEFKLDLPVQP